MQICLVTKSSFLLKSIGAVNSCKCVGQIRAIKEWPLATGEVSLPGGKREKQDKDLIFTATREAHEEIGLAPADVRPLCYLPPILSYYGISVHPIVAYIPKPRNLYPTSQEVSSTFHVPLQSFLTSSNHRFFDHTYGYTAYRMHIFDIHGNLVWGITARVLILAARLVFRRDPDFEVDPPGGVSYGAIRLSNGDDVKDVSETQKQLLTDILAKAPLLPCEDTAMQNIGLSKI